MLKQLSIFSFHRFIIFFLIIFLPLKINALHHVFIDLAFQEKQVSIGIFKPNNLLKKEIAKIPIIKIEKYNPIFSPTGKGEVLIYIHAMFGNQTNWHRGSLRAITGMLQDNPNITKVISILWNAPSLGYKKSWQEADKRGALFGGWLSKLCKNHPLKINILCHSMGHRFFEGAINEMEYVNFNRIIFAAPDLNNDFFTVYFKKFQNNVQQIIVYKHLKDKLLRISKKIHKRQRMGFDGIKNFEEISQKLPIELRDVTHTKSDKKLDLTNHSYFKTHGEIRCEIQEIFQ